jgi:hypothetical protein
VTNRSQHISNYDPDEIPSDEAEDANNAINDIHDNIVGIKGTIKRYTMKDRLTGVPNKSSENLRVNVKLQNQ